MQFKKSIQLALSSYSSLPQFHNIVNTSNFLIRLSPRLFFSTTNPEVQPWAWHHARVNFLYKKSMSNV